MLFYTLMLAASVSLLIPYDYQTNIMRKGLDLYIPKEFMKFVIPLQIILSSFSNLYKY